MYSHTDKLNDFNLFHCYNKIITKSIKPKGVHLILNDFNDNEIILNLNNINDNELILIWNDINDNEIMLNLNDINDNDIILIGTILMIMK